MLVSQYDFLCLDWLMVAVKDVVGEQYHAHGADDF